MKNRWFFLVSVFFSAILLFSSFSIVSADFTALVDLSNADGTQTLGSALCPSNNCLYDVDCSSGTCPNLNGFYLNNANPAYIRAHTLGCQEVNVASSTSIFIPVKYAQEWTSFVNAGFGGSGVTVAPCAEPAYCAAGDQLIDPANRANDKDCPAWGGKVCCAGDSACSVGPCGGTPCANQCSALVAYPTPAHASPDNTISCATIAGGPCDDSVDTWFKCDTHYHMNATNDGCDPDTGVCVGGPLPNATMCPEDENGVSMDTAVHVVSACSPLPNTSDGVRCECECNPGFVKSGAVCLPSATFSCTGVLPANATICSGDDTSLTGNTPLTFSSGCPADIVKCEFDCDAGFAFDGSSCQQDCKKWRCESEVWVEVTGCGYSCLDDVPGDYYEGETACIYDGPPSATCNPGANPYVCTGPTPANSSICGGDANGLSADTPKVLVDAPCVPNTDKCEYICNTGFVRSGAACVPLGTCTGFAASSWDPCPGDDVGLTADAPRIVVSACSAPDGSEPKCEHTCAAGFSFDGGSCHKDCAATTDGSGGTQCTIDALVHGATDKPQTCAGAGTCTASCTDGAVDVKNLCTEDIVCTGAPAWEPNAHLCPGDDSGLTVPTPKVLVGACSAIKKCEYLPYLCTGATFANAGMCTGDGPPLTADTPKTLVPACLDNTTKCENVCKGGYHYNPVGPVCDPNVFVCVGSTLPNSTPCPNDDQGLTANTATKLMSTCSLTNSTNTDRCEYICASGYHYNPVGPFCEPDTFYCLPPIPSPTVATICPNDDAGLTANTPVKMVASAANCSLVNSGNINRCEYFCNVGYSLVGGVCHKNCNPTTNGSGNTMCSFPALLHGQSGGTCALQNTCSGTCADGVVGSITNNCTVPPFVCTGMPPATNSTICPNDAVGLSANRPAQLVAACTPNTSDAFRCEFTCNTNYTKVANTCKAPCAPPASQSGYSWPAMTLHGAQPSPALSKVTPITGGSVACSRVETCNDGAWNYVSETCTTTCSSGYTKVGDVCYANCAAASNNSGEWGGTCSTSAMNHGQSGGTCDYSGTCVGGCNDGVVDFDFYDNQCAAPSFICTGSNPPNAILCPNDNSGLTGNTPKTSVAACTMATKCEYQCKPAYTFNGDSCVMITCGDGTCNGTETCSSCYVDCYDAGGCPSADCRTYRCHNGVWSGGTASCDSPCNPDVWPRDYTEEYVCISDGWPGAPCVDGGSSGGCFVAGTKVLLGDGAVKPIEEVRQGDIVQGADKLNTVERVIVLAHDGWLYSLNGGEYFVTEVHPFMTQGGVWKAFDPEGAMKEAPELVVELLQVGDVLITRDGSVALTKVDRIWNKGAVYNFVVNNAHDYYADGYLVHNKEQCGDGYPCYSPKVCDGSMCVNP